MSAELDVYGQKCSNCHAGNCDMMGLTLGEVQRSFSAISHILYGKTWPVGGSTALLKAASSS